MRLNLGTRTLVVAMAAGWIACSAIEVQAQQKPPGQSAAYYEQYEPSQRQRLRRETCGRDEDSVGPFCVKRCDKGFIHVVGSKPYRCRSIEPMQPGQVSTGVRRQTGVQPGLAAPREPVRKGNDKP